MKKKDSSISQAPLKCWDLYVKQPLILTTLRGHVIITILQMGELGYTQGKCFVWCHTASERWSCSPELFSLNSVPKLFPIIFSVKLCACQLDQSLIQASVFLLIKLGGIDRFSLRSFQWFSFHKHHQKDEFTHCFHVCACCRDRDFWDIFSFLQRKTADQHLYCKVWPATGGLPVLHSMGLVVVHMYWMSRAHSIFCVGCVLLHNTLGP